MNDMAMLVTIGIALYVMLVLISALFVCYYTGGATRLAVGLGAIMTVLACVVSRECEKREAFRISITDYEIKNKDMLALLANHQPWMDSVTIYTNQLSHQDIRDAYDDSRWAHGVTEPIFRDVTNGWYQFDGEGDYLLPNARKDACHWFIGRDYKGKVIRAEGYYFDTCPICDFWSCDIAYLIRDNG